MAIMDSKFSTFADGGDLAINDIIVGLRDGLNTKFVASGFPGLYLPLAGGTMAGGINMDSNSITGLPIPSNPTDAASKAYADLMLPLSGGTMSGVIAMGTNKITGMGDPTLAQDAATKFYVDAQITASSPLTTKGDLWGYTTVNARLPVGSTNGQLLQVNSAVAAGLSYSTATYPTSTTANQILFSSAANVISEISTANNSVLVTNVSGTPSLSTTLPSGLTIPGYQPTITPAALTKTDDTNVTLTLGGFPSTALLNAASLTLGWAGQLSLSRGGTNASLIASNGAIPYSTATAMALLAPGSSGQLFQSGGAGAPSWSTSTYPSANAINTLLYASSSNVMSALATANNGTLITSAGGVPSISSTLPTAVQGNITQLGAQSQALDMNTHLINNVVDPVSAQDAATKNYVDTLGSTYTFRYVNSFGGVDATTSGSVLRPYATITYATAQITDNTASKPYFLICYGKFTETSLKVKSYIYLQGNGSQLTCTNPVNLDATFPSAGTAWIEGFSLTGNISLDFTSLTGSSVIIKNNSTSGSPTWTITGPTSLFIVCDISSNVSIIGGILLTVTNALSIVSRNTLSTSTLSQTNSSASNSSCNLLGNIHIGGLTVSTTGTKGMTVNYSGVTTSTLSLSAASSGAPLFTGVGCSDFTAISISGTPCVLKPDLLSVTPSFSGGAVDGTNVLYPSLAASVAAGFTPTNYTAANTRVRAHLEGIDTKLGVISPATNSFIYVYVCSTGGVDAVGNGSILRPYATISYALTQITDNTSAKRYIIFANGVFTETTLTMKPWVLLEGNGSFLTVDTWALDAAFTTTNALFYVNNFIISASGATSNMTIAFSSGTTPRVVVTNLKSIVRLTLNISGPTTGNANAAVSNNIVLLSSGNFVDLTLNNCSGVAQNNTCRNMVLSSSSSSGAHQIYTSGNIVGLSSGSLSCTTNGTGTIAVISDDIYIPATLTLTANTGAATLRAKGCEGFSAITINNSGAVLTPDLLSVTPTFAGTAVDGTACVYPSLAASVTAGFSPTNYTAANTRVRSHLEGIDAQLAGFNVGNKSLGTATNDNAVALHVGEYVSSSVLVGSAVSLTTGTPANVTSIVLTAGDWDVSETTIFNPNVLTTSSDLRTGISSTSATMPTLGAENNSSFTTQTFAAGLTQSLSVGVMRVPLGSTTTIYLVAQATFAINTMSAYGFIGARRRR